MTSYHSVINTAKNGRLIRAEIREYVLGMALYCGFCKDPILAEKLYPGDDHRIRQCTFLTVPNEPAPGRDAWPYAWPICFAIGKDLVKTIRSYFKVAGQNDTATMFYDTKKFRIYYDRLVWGREKKITLKKTIQYIWTNYLAMLCCLYGRHQMQDPYYIDISSFHMYQYAKDRDETDQYMQRYLDDIIHIPCVIYDGTIYFESEVQYQAFWDMTNQEAKRIFLKLEKGKYLG